MIAVCAVVCSLKTYNPSPESNELAYDVHFWIGSQSTQVSHSVYNNNYNNNTNNNNNNNNNKTYKNWHCSYFLYLFCYMTALYWTIARSSSLSSIFYFWIFFLPSFFTRVKIKKNNNNSCPLHFRGEMRSHSKVRSLPASLLQFVIFISFLMSSCLLGLS